MATEALRLEGWALILGASSGFGATTARHLARCGMNVVGVHLDRRNTQHLADAVRDDIRGRRQPGQVFQRQRRGRRSARAGAGRSRGRAIGASAAGARGAALAGLRHAAALYRRGRRPGHVAAATGNDTGRDGELAGVLDPGPGGAGLAGRRLTDSGDDPAPGRIAFGRDDGAVGAAKAAARGPRAPGWPWSWPRGR